MTKPLDSFRIIPHADLTPAGCLHLAERGESALAFLDSKGIARGLRSCLALAVQRLHDISARGFFGPSDEDLLLDVDAAVLTIDFFQISRCLGDDIPEIVSEELEKALSSDLRGVVQQRQAREFKSQFWIASLLVAIGVEPKVIPNTVDGRKPDYIADFDALDVAFEVKRPKSENSMIDALDRGAGQLRDFGKPGILCLDLTDCIVTTEERLAAISERRQITQAKFQQFSKLTAKINDRPGKYTRSNKYQRILGTLSFARTVEWKFHPNLQTSDTTHVHVRMFPAACGGMVANQLPRIRRKLLEGVDQLSGAAPGFAS